MIAEQHTVTSSCGKYSRNVWIQRGPNSPHHVAIFLDAELYLEKLNCLPILEASTKNSEIPPMTYVFVSSKSPEARHEDYVCNSNHSRFITEDVVRWAREHHSSILPQQNLIAGLSLSGLAAAHIALHHPTVFSHALCQSGSFWWLVGRDLSLPPTKAKMWLSVGGQETESGVAHPPTDLFQAVSQIEGVEKAARRFEGLGATVRHHVYEGGHGIAWFREDLSPALRWLIGNSRHAIRPFRDEDQEAVVRVWHRSGKAAYDFLPLWQSLTLDRAATIFREVIAGKVDLWVGTLDTRIFAFLAMNDSYIDRMYVDPDHWHEGWGTRLLDFAKSRSPQGLELHTHQENHRARQFYEKHGFKAVKFGISPPPESAPDVEYHWRATAP